jgi:hypothetical protein
MLIWIGLIACVAIIIGVVAYNARDGGGNDWSPW